MKSKILSAVLAAAMLLSLMSGAALAASVTTEKPLVTGGTAAPQFADVPANHWAYQVICKVTAAGLFQGTGGNLFEPDAGMTRAMFVVVLARLDGAKVDNAQSTQFPDVPANTWYSGAVAWAVANKLAEGYDDGRFAPNRDISRQEIAVFLYRYLHGYKQYTLKEAPLVASFADSASVSAYARDAVEFCRLHGLIGGYADGTYRPLQTVTRAEVAAMFSRIILILAEQPGGDTGGGTGGGGGTVTTYYYGLGFKAEKAGTNYGLNVFNSLNAGEKNLAGSTAVLAAFKTLYSGTNGNDTAVKNSIETALARLAGRSFTATLSGNQITVQISETRVISAAAVVPFTQIMSAQEIAGSEMKPLGVTVTESDILAALDALAAGRALTDAQRAALPDIIAAAKKVAGYTDEQLQAQIDQRKASLTEAQQKALENLGYGDLRSAASTFAAAAGAAGESVAAYAPVTMTVKVDLARLLDKSNTRYLSDASFTTVLGKLAAQGIDTGDQDTGGKIRALYDLFAPKCFLTGNTNGTVSLLTADAYLALIDPRVDALEACRTGVQIQSGTTRAEAFQKALTTLNARLGAMTGLTLTLTDAQIRGLARTAALAAPTLAELYDNVGAFEIKLIYEAQNTEQTYANMNRAAGYFDRDLSAYADLIRAALKQAFDAGASGTYSGTLTFNRHI